MAGKKPSKCVLYEVEYGVATITLNRPRVKNAFSKELWIDLILALRSASSDQDVVIVVITGAGEYFSSGKDLNNFRRAKEMGMTKNEYQIFENQPLIKVISDALIDFPKHIVAAVNGPAIGIGTTMLGLVDVVYASDTATFRTPFSSLGVTAEACSSYTFPKIMGYSKAHEVLYFGRKLTALEAKECGFVSEVFPLDTFQREVQMRARKFAALPPRTLHAARALCREAERQKLMEVNQRELDLLAQRADNDENKKAISDFFVRKSKM